MNTFDDFDFDVSAMKQDLSRVDKKPGDMSANRSEKYVILPKGEGVTKLRILPPDKKRGYKMPYASTRLHYINGRAYHCLREWVDGKWRGNCPICNWYHALFQKADDAKTKDEGDAIRDAARKIKPVERYYYNSVVREYIDPETGEKQRNVGPRILSVGKSLHGRVLRAFLGNEKFKEPPLGNISHPFKGRDFKLIKEIVKSNGQEYPNYDSSRFEDESVAGSDEQIAQWLDTLWDLESERESELKTYEELQEQVEIAQGKRPDPAIGFDVSEYDLPQGMNVAKESVVEQRPAPRQTPKPEAQPSRAKKQESASKKATQDVPFDFDLDEMPDVDAEPDWVKDIQSRLDSAKD